LVKNSIEAKEFHLGNIGKTPRKEKLVKYSFLVEGNRIFFDSIFPPGGLSTNIEAALRL